MESNKNIAIKDISLDPQRESFNIGIFSEKPHFIFLSKKTQKLVSALYLITNLWDNAEPLKHSVRDSAVKLIPAIILLKDKNSFNTKRIIADIKNNIFEAVAFIEVGFYSGLMSEMNLSIIKSQFTALVKDLESRPLSHDEDIIPKDFFAGSTHEMALGETKHQYAAADMSFNKTLGQKSDLVSGSIYKGHTTGIQPQNNQRDNLKIRVTNENKKSSRKNLILTLFNTKTEIDIKDVSGLLKDCGKKTVQRELLSLVADGVLKKEGEKRWSKYRLA